MYDCSTLEFRLLYWAYLFPIVEHDLHDDLTVDQHQTDVVVGGVAVRADQGRVWFVSGEFDLKVG